jgi:hypothetical protein
MSKVTLDRVQHRRSDYYCRPLAAGPEAIRCKCVGRGRPDKADGGYASSTPRETLRLPAPSPSTAS